MEIRNTRVFDAPRETVFDAFENPTHLAEWWGPNGFTNKIRKFDFRPGGVWRITMHGPDGQKIENEKQFLEVVRPEKVVFNHMQPMHEFQMTMTYEDAPGGKTKLTWRMVFESAVENEKLKSFIEQANEQNFDRLAAFLRKAG